METAAGLVVTGDSDALHQILHALLDNALRYAATSVTVQAKTGLSGQQAVVEITNDIAPLSPSQRGTGLGLRLARGLSAAVPGWKFTSGQEGDLYRATLQAPTA